MLWQERAQRVEPVLGSRRNIAVILLGSDDCPTAATGFLQPEADAQLASANVN
jgi:hypothetical protein